MVLGSYYRLYLWVFFYSFFALMFAAIIGDSITSSTSSRKFPRFISCLACFACSTLSLWIHHKLTTRAVNVDYLNTETKGWLAKYTKPSKNKKKKRKVKSSVKITLFLSHFFSNFVNLIPITAVAICMLIPGADSWCNGQNSGSGSFVDKWFFGIATVLRYAAWYPTMIIAHLFLFPRRQRLKMVV